MNDLYNRCTCMHVVVKGKGSFAHCLVVASCLVVGEFGTPPRADPDTCIIHRKTNKSVL